MKGYCTNLSIGSYGRFCNMLYQVAGVIGVARKNGLQPVFRPLVNLDHKERFGSNEDIDVWKYFEHPLPKIPDGIRWQDKPLEWGYHDVRLGPGNWNLSGHFQSFKYFAHCFDEVKWYMKMKDEYKPTDAIALHLRLGDYDGAYHPRLDMNYYAPALEHFDKNLPVLVFSDDKPAANRMFQGKRFKIFSGIDYIVDFRKMKSCRHFIIGNSSYSAMAAILGEAPDKKVIAPSPWFGPKYTSITGKDIYCDDWTVIDWERQKVTA